MRVKPDILKLPGLCKFLHLHFSGPIALFKHANQDDIFNTSFFSGSSNGSSGKSA